MSGKQTRRTATRQPANRKSAAKKPPTLDDRIVDIEQAIQVLAAQIEQGEQQIARWRQQLAQNQGAAQVLREIRESEPPAPGSE